jgi:hypothetical protein
MGLTHIGDAACLVSFDFGPGQGGQEKGGQDRDNRDNHQQFDQRETLSDLTSHAGVIGLGAPLESVRQSRAR